MDISKLLTAIMSKLVLSNKRVFAIVLVALTALSAALAAGLTVPICEGADCQPLLGAESALARVAPIISTVVTVVAGLLSTPDATRP